MRQTVMTTAISGTAENIVIQGSNFVCTQVGGNSNTLTCYLLNAEGVPTGSTSSIVVAAQASEAATRLHQVGADHQVLFSKDVKVSRLWV